MKRLFIACIFALGFTMAFMPSASANSETQIQSMLVEHEEEFLEERIECSLNSGKPMGVCNLHDRDIVISICERKHIRIVTYNTIPNYPVKGVDTYVFVFSAKAH